MIVSLEEGYTIQIQLERQHEVQVVQMRRGQQKETIRSKVYVGQIVRRMATIIRVRTTRSELSVRVNVWNRPGD